MHYIRTIHASQRFDRTVLALVAGVRTLFAAFTGVGPDVLTFTELGNNTRWRSLLRWSPWWEFVQVEKGNGTDDCAAAFRKGVWRVDRVDPHRLSPLPVSGRGSHRIWALVVTATHLASGRQGVFVVVHFPAHIDGGNGWRGGIDTDCMRDCVATLRGLAHRWGRNYDFVLVAADWNLSALQQWVVTYLRTALVMALAFPREGTHGSRPIDGWAFLGRLRLVGVPQVLRRGPFARARRRASDHWPVAAVFRLF